MSTSRAGRNAGRHDARRRPGAGVWPSPQDRTRSVSREYLRERRPDERDGMLGNNTGDECQDHVSVIATDSLGEYAGLDITRI